MSAARVWQLLRDCRRRRCIVRQGQTSRFQWHSDWVGALGWVLARLTVLAAKRTCKAVFLSVDIGGPLHGTRVVMDAERGIVELL